MWVLRWQVQSHSDPSRRYTVAVDEHGAWGCDCPQGRYRRDRGHCKHIREVQAGSPEVLPSGDPRAITIPPAVAAATTSGRARLRNVKVVLAAMRSATGTTRDHDATTPSTPASILLAALEE